MPEGLLASISLSSFSGDSSFPFDWGFLLCLCILGDSFCLFLHLRLLSFACLSSCGGLLWFEIWDLVVQSLWPSDLDVLGLPFIQFMWAPLLYLGFDYGWLIHCWVLPSSWLTECHNFHDVVVQVLVNKTILPENQPTPGKIPPWHISNINSNWAKLMKVERN